MQRRRVGIIPASAAVRLHRLLAALEHAYPVCFVPVDAVGAARVDAMIALGVDPPGSPDIPWLVCPALTDGGHTSSGGLVAFGRSNSVDARLRGRTIAESDAPDRTVAPSRDDETLALRDGRPVWTVRDAGQALVHFAACPPDDLIDGEPLKRHFRTGRFLRLLPLIAFLRQVTADCRLAPPPLRALLMFDDPNLRWRSYGHIDYADLARHALRHRYHVAMAMVPLDTVGPLDPRASSIFRAHSAVLSLLMHGIHHGRRELMRELPSDARRDLAAWAMRRIVRFQARTGVDVSRVMCAPHGEASEAFLRTFLDAGLDAFCADIPYPWTIEDPPTNGPPLLGWEGASFVAGGLPVLPRYPFTYDPGEIVLRAYLDHPLVLYGHHADVAEGLDVLARTAELVNSLGASWGSAAWLARTNFLSAQRGQTFRIRLLARKVRVVVPAETAVLEVEIPPGRGAGEEHELALFERRIPVRLSSAVTVTVSTPAAAAHDSGVTIELRPRQVAPFSHQNRSTARRPEALLRRVATEGRDRLLPVAANARSRARGKARR